jgi:hypothetical protein
VIDNAQTARLTLSLCMVPLAAWALYHKYYIIFLFSPVFALNADYALYGRSYPVLAALVSLVRVIVPYLVVLIVLPLAPGHVTEAFFISSVAVYFAVGLFITRFLHRPYWPRPSLKSLKLYWKSLDLGIAGLSYYFIGLGLITVAANFYADSVVAVAYVGCKMYMIFKGVLRIISQSFVREMINEHVQLQVDRLAGFAGFLFLAGTAFYPSTFLRLFLNKALDMDGHMLLILGLSGLIAAILLSYPNKAILLKRDRPYSIAMAIGASGSIILCIILSYFKPSPGSVFISILAGEVLCFLGMAKLFGSRQNLAPRLVIWSKYGLMSAIPLTTRIFFGDTYPAFFAGIGMMIVVFLLVFHKKLRLT